MKLHFLQRYQQLQVKFVNTKFNIGDKVSYASGDVTVFEIAKIRIDYQGTEYFDDTNHSYDEKYLTLYIEPKKKVIKYLWAYETIYSGRTLLSGFLEDADDIVFETVYDKKQIKFMKRLDFSATEFED